MDKGSYHQMQNYLQKQILKEVFTENNISTDFIITDDSRPTTVKSRIISKDHQVVRMDREVSDVNL